MQARNARFVERLPDFVMEEVLSKILPLVE